MSPTRYTMRVASSFVLLASVQSSLLADDDLLRESVDSHSSTVQLIRTFHCNLAIERFPNAPVPAELGEYWRSGNDFRCKQRQGTSIYEAEYKNGVIRQYMLDNATRSDGGRNSGRITNRDSPFLCDAWNFGLLTFYGRERFRVDLKELCEDKDTKKSAKHETKDGRKLIRIDVKHSRGT